MNDCPHNCHVANQYWRTVFVVIDLLLLVYSIKYGRAAWAAFWAFCLTTNIDIVMCNWRGGSS